MTTHRLPEVSKTTACGAAKALLLRTSVGTAAETPAVVNSVEENSSTLLLFATHKAGLLFGVVVV